MLTFELNTRVARATKNRIYEMLMEWIRAVMVDMRDIVTAHTNRITGPRGLAYAGPIR